MDFGSFDVERVVLLACIVFVTPLHQGLAIPSMTRASTSHLFPDKLLSDSLLDCLVILVLTTIILRLNRLRVMRRFLLLLASTFLLFSLCSSSSLLFQFLFAAELVVTPILLTFLNLKWSGGTISTSSSFFRFSSRSFRSFSLCSLERKTTLCASSF